MSPAALRWLLVIAEPANLLSLLRVLMSKSVFDLDGLCDRIAGRLDLVDELISMLLAQYPQDRERLIDRLQEDDGPGARDVAHRMKGQMQTLGVNRAAERARQIEYLCRDGRIDVALATVWELDGEIRHFQDTINAWYEAK